MLHNTIQHDEIQRRSAWRIRLKRGCDDSSAGDCGEAGRVLHNPQFVCQFNHIRKNVPDGFAWAGKPTLVLFVGSLILLLALPAGASIITYSDDTFTPSNWSMTTQTIGLGGNASAIQQSSGGDPAAYRQVTIDVVGSSDSEVYAFNLKNGATVAPASSGAIISLTFTKARNTTGQEFGPAIEQGSNLYYAYAGSGGTSGWQSTMMTFTAGAPTNNLLTSFRTDTDGSAHPDFSAAGAPMTFGFVAIDNSTSKSFTAVSGYDNWSMSVTTTSSVPEPGNVANIGWLVLTCWALVRRPRRPV